MGFTRTVPFFLISVFNVSEQLTEVKEMEGKKGKHQLVDVKETAEYLDKSSGSIYNEVAAGKFPIPVIRIGRSIKFDLNDLDAYIEAQRKKG